MDKCHFIGIGGIGMSGLAQILLHNKIAVSGSDIQETPLTRNLHEKGAKIFIGQNERNIDAGMTVVYSSGIHKDNPEYQAAIEKKCKMLHRSELLQHIMSGFKTLAVTGTHGKTTTSSLLTTVLHTGSLDPSFAVGGILRQFSTNAKAGKGAYFVAEADESDGTFLKYHPEGAIVTNISADHMDFFGGIEAVIESYKTFIRQVKNPSLLFWCGDDINLKSLKIPGTSYGFNEHNEVQGSHFRQEGWHTYFTITFQGKTYPDIELALTGKHNAQNALAVFGLATRLGVPEDAIRKAFKEFQGVGRRCEEKGTVKTVTVYDDYAHHPKEINATLLAIRQAVEERRLVVLFQPHRYSRTADCLGTYSTIFNHADVLFVTDIYAAGEKPRPGIDSHQIIKEVAPYFPGTIHYSSKEKLIENVLPELRPNDVVVTLGAGDITSMGGQLLNALQNYALKKWRVGLVYGGKSVEHEISLRSARYIFDNLNRELYDVSLFGITRDGSWTLPPDVVELTEQHSIIEHAVIDKILSCDVMFPALHGLFGEDGTIQGFFEMLDVAYVGCCHRAASIAMDKALTKKLMLFSGIPTASFIEVNHPTWLKDPDHLIKRVTEKFSFPVYVKPVHLGSSVGVSRVASINELTAAIEKAFQVDSKIIVENEIVGREIEFAVFGNEFIHVFPPGEILRDGGGVYTYEAKYGSNSFKTAVVSELPSSVIEEGMFLAEKAFEAIEGCGFARIDFFLDKNNHLWLNEINPIPGFTSISLYPKMCEAHGYGIAKLIDKLIGLALQRKSRERSSRIAS